MRWVAQSRSLAGFEQPTVSQSRSLAGFKQPARRQQRAQFLSVSADPEIGSTSASPALIGAL
jgi:hypothetical protein